MRSPTRFTPTVLWLEDRTNPAGNITARVIDGTLFVDGDALANSFVIAGAGWRSVTVRPGDSDTTINGQSGSVSIGDITRGIVVRGGDGEDTITLEGVQNRRYIGVFGEGGEDVITLSAVNSRGGAEVVGGDADDTVRVLGGTFRKTLAVDLGAGDDTLEVRGANVRGRTPVSGGEGTDTLTTAGNSLARSLGYRQFEQSPAGSGPLPAVPPVVPTAPTVTLASSAGESTAGETIPFTVAFSQPVTGFTLEDLGVTNGVPTDLDSSDNTVFTFSVIPSADGAVTIALPANVATNSDGLGNTIAESITVVSIRTDSGMTDIPPSGNETEFEPTGSGLSVWDIQTGTGTPVSADTTSQVQVFYTGWLLDGTVFDSARTAGQPAAFSLEGVIPGFREGLIGMQAGGIRRLLIPPELGYGSTGSGSIPPNSTLIFEVKMVKVS